MDRAKTVKDLEQVMNPVGVDIELEAMQTVAEVMRGLDRPARKRVLDWVSTRFEMGPGMVAVEHLGPLLNDMFAAIADHASRVGDSRPADEKLWKVLKGSKWESQVPESVRQGWS